MSDMFQLKEYQRRCLGELAGYFRRIVALGGVTDVPEKLAFAEDPKRSPYQPVKELPGLPYVCLRVPTSVSPQELRARTCDLLFMVSGEPKAHVRLRSPTGPFGLRHPREACRFQNRTLKATWIVWDRPNSGCSSGRASYL